MERKTYLVCKEGILIKSILSVTSLYFISIIMMLKTVLKEMIKI